MTKGFFDIDDDFNETVAPRNPHGRGGDTIVGGNIDDHSTKIPISAPGAHIYFGSSDKPQTPPPSIEPDKKTVGNEGKGGGHTALIVTIVILIVIIIVGGFMFVNMMNSNNSSTPYYPPSTAGNQNYVQQTYEQPTVTYAVVFDTGGYDIIPLQLIDEGGYVSRPSSPYRDGYNFGGWFTSPACTTPWSFGTPVYDNLVLYAKWDYIQPTITHTVTFDTGGYGYVSSQSVNDGGYVSKPSSPSRDGYEFGGWYTTPTCTSPWSFGTQVYSDMILYAKWNYIQPVIVTHTVSFDTRGYGSIASQSVIEGEYVSRPSTPYREGYDFDGWYTSSSYTTQWDFSQPVTSDLVLYAKWTAPAGSAESPIPIASADEFMKIYNKPSLHYKLAADIDLTGYSIPSDVRFSGTLDGKGYTITGSTHGSNSIQLDSTKYGSTKYFGLFSVNSGTIKNLKLQNFGIDGGEQDYAGISDSKKYAYFGSVAGLNEGTISEVSLSNCNVKDMRMWGGCGLLVGQNKGTISNCNINGGSLAGDCDVGGIAGVNDGTIRSCSVRGSSISFTENSWVIFVGYNGRSVGGIVGYASSSSSLIDSCSVSDIHISYDLRVDACHIGSIAGSNYGKVSGCTAAGVSPSMNKCGVNNGSET